MDRQQIFEKCVNGVLEQGIPCFNEEQKSCLYRMPDGQGDYLKCAAGFLIPDDEYNAACMEGETASEVIKRSFLGMNKKLNPEEEKRLQKEYVLALKMIDELQSAHDGHASPYASPSANSLYPASIGKNFLKDFRESAIEIGRQYGLTSENIINAY